MGITKKSAALMSMFLGMAMSMSEEWMSGRDEQYKELSPDEKKELDKRIRDEKEKERQRQRASRYKKQGLKEWTYYKKVDDDRIEIKIYALNKRNADRKAKKMGCVII